AIALALRFRAPIFVHDRVMQKSRTGRTTGDAGEVLDESEEGKKWADYLEKLSPEDFGKYKV
ncbi:MAG: bifunctional nuclease family protein, partial [Desulfosarcina sp.]